MKLTPSLLPRPALTLQGLSRGRNELYKSYCETTASNSEDKALRQLVSADQSLFFTEK